jgi:hypothetical protein
MLDYPVSEDVKRTDRSSLVLSAMPWNLRLDLLRAHMSRRMLVFSALFVILACVAAPAWAAPNQQGRAVITYPSNGMMLGGIVDVRGIATHPNINFYQLRYAPGSNVTGETQWVDFAIVQATSVENDVLASWDTTTLPDGPYVLALAVWGVDDSANPYLFFVEYLTVDNTQFVPTPEQETATPEPLPTAEAGPTPTPVTIEQPSTPTPRPTPTVGGIVGEELATPTAETGLSLELPVSAGALRDAFCRGGAIAVLLLLLWALYLLLKLAVRYFLRRSRDPRVL